MYNAKKLAQAIYDEIAKQYVKNGGVKNVVKN